MHAMICTDNTCTTYFGRRTTFSENQERNPKALPVKLPMHCRLFESKLPPPLDSLLDTVQLLVDIVKNNFT